MILFGLCLLGWKTTVVVSSHLEAHSICFSFIVELNFDHLAKIVSSLFIIKLLYSLHLQPISSLQRDTLRTERSAFPLKPSLKHGGHWWFLPDCLYWPHRKMISFPTLNSSLHLPLGIQHVFIFKKIKKSLLADSSIQLFICLSIHVSMCMIHIFLFFSILL